MVKKIKKTKSTLKTRSSKVAVDKAIIFKQVKEFESILKNSMEHAVITIDMKGVIQDCNKCSVIAYGYTASDLIGNNISILYKTDNTKIGGIKSLLNLAKHAGKWKGTVKCIMKKCNQKMHLINIITRTDTNNNIIGFNFISKPLLEQEPVFKLQLSQELLRVKNIKLKKINDKMCEVSRLKNEFLANMSHDLRTPLNGIIGFAEIMHDGKVGPVSTDHKEYLEEILSNSQLLLLLINDTLDLAKIESGKMEFTPQVIDLYTTITEVRTIFDKIQTDKNITIDIDVDPSLKVNIDPTKLKQVIYNLVSNAFKCSYKNGHISIVVLPESNDFFRLEVRDAGIGIRKKDLPKLFIEFQQLESSSTKRYQGSGLGLVLTKRIVEAQGGRVGVESAYKKGSTFYIVLPFDAPKGKYGYVQPKNKSSPKGHPTILIIENKSSEREELKDLLISKGYTVNTADTIDEAIRDDQVSQADAIVLDFFTSDISKWKILRAFRCKKPFKKAPALLIAGVVSKTEAFWFKIHDFLVKPVDPHELVDALRWSGVTPHSNKLVLIIDDKKLFKPHNKVLKENGYKCIYESDLTTALSVVENTKPDVLILNPFIESKKLNGFDFLQQMRLTVRGRYTPIVITTLTTLDENQKEHIKGIIQRVVLKRESLSKNLIDEITKQYPINRNTTSD